MWAGLACSKHPHRLSHKPETPFACMCVCVWEGTRGSNPLKAQARFPVSHGNNKRPFKLLSYDDAFSIQPTTVYFKMYFVVVHS